MLFLFNKIVLAMATCRIISSCLELTAALLMLKFNSVETAFKINAGLALVGPVILLSVTLLGLVGLSGKISPLGMFWVILGVILIFYGLHKI
ncbi:MAG: YqhV family protein [Clostridia bacterium]|nr:YqhV family protein [Clostridia bacterium]